jgi:hypothetical protein
LREEIDRSSMFEEIVGSCEPIRQVLKQVAKVAPSDSTVLILGETGTGKELIARALHRRSNRAARAFVRVNCAAINLLSLRRTAKLEGRLLPAPRQAVLFRTLCADALEHSRAENAGKSTHELQLKINAFLPVFGDRAVEEITKQEIVRWLTEQAEERNWKSSSRNRWQAAFSLIFRVGIDNEKITKKPCGRYQAQDREQQQSEISVRRRGARRSQGDRSSVSFSSAAFDTHGNI